MRDLEEEIRRLSASFAEEVVAALREVPLEELIALSADGGDAEGRKAPAPVRARRTRKKPALPRSTNGAVDGAAGGAAQEGLAPSTFEAAERLFAERGARGATVAQLAEGLAARGVATPDCAADVLRVLVEREIIRDAGFRRTTGRGTAPVFILSTR